ncbi:hypothetical protein VB774_07425 [Pseudanabaena galeata UHCC 0370]|uniref:Uncharacterized protein n=1 Tax=Pseudanabaena galeata UHCC 0370 TaxID=3110310 RepID=A0ABU5TII0_9CYAN|nr:hypothetical protein [Pseudanabaena galeata]MEA5477448.1 hypothetical protein [Pseudanabaena galeata UHCC 0370]
MKSYLPIGQHQIGYPQVWQRANTLAISGFAMTIGRQDAIGICGDIFGDISGDRRNLESPDHSVNKGSRRDVLTSLSRLISAINPETYPSGRYRQIAIPT